MGSSIQKMLPSPCRLVTPVAPPMASTSWRDSARPSPVPSIPAVAASSRSKDEQPGDVTLGDPAPGVDDVDAQPITGPGLGAERHVASWVVVLDGVGEQVEQDLPEPLVVGSHIGVGRELRRWVQMHAA